EPAVSRRLGADRASRNPGAVAARRRRLPARRRAARGEPAGRLKRGPVSRRTGGSPVPTSGWTARTGGSPVLRQRAREALMNTDLIDLVQNLGRPRVLVVGDLMLDRYVWGDAERISQEAPVILLHADKREERLGGASSVATLLRALDAKVGLAGVVGADSNATRIRQLLTDLDIDQEAVLTD